MARVTRVRYVPTMGQITSPRQSTVADVVRRTAQRTPEATAVAFGDRTWTYREWDSAVTALARHFVGLGLKHGDRVAAFGANSDLYVLTYLACARAGLVHVPINYQMRGDELDYFFTDSGATVVFADAALAEHVTATASGPTLSVRTFEDLVPVAAADAVEPQRDDEFAVVDTDVAQLLYTSGTTSAPKGAIMTHRALIHHYLSCLDVLDFEASDRMVHALPLYHSAQMHVFLLPALMKGGFNLIVPGPVPAQLFEIFETERITAFFAAPTVWVALANHDEFGARDLSSLAKGYYGASIMPGPVLARLREALPDMGFYNAFGQSEMGPVCTVLRPEEHDAHPGSAGRPVLFVETRVVDPSGKDVVPGEQGEILYRSPQLCEGYWNKPEATEEAFRGGWFHSGDLVVQDEEGFIEVVDRVKDVINTGGVLVASRQVEDAIFELDAVAEVAVVGTPDEKWIEAITAYVVKKGEIDGDAVIAHVRERLAPFKVPKAVHFIDELPKNTSGKILKRQLRS
ncbi:fatty-acyl-CoA synthase [Brevibacterium jeotgali]|uniref:Fatty-acyl-CoA synthase n=2 Tax=Brevibacterium jeotgali TaxID=1262550 RepID=A0A2H1L891_9MICO|nr:fatty-acyl-CoA synthase [Brevibacterium jeotgali]SMY13117.1 fatty-acyl-CoA synthase [Brevibacterium jeotgali]